MLQVNEIYTAISGESRYMGWPCTLVRLTGCHIRCNWCDSAHSFSDGESLSVIEVMDQIRKNKFRTVLVTGGEPLLQADIGEFLNDLLADDRRVLLETSGTLLPGKGLSLLDVPDEVHRVVDLKAPGSGIASKFIDWQGLACLGSGDEIKVVCAGRDDYLWARDLVLQGGHWDPNLRVSFSPVQDTLAARDLAEWILADSLDVCFQIQLHKAVWPDNERGV
ncbi:MAG: radical SAM protein [bacterium]|nr:radical SAM protein [bacterium]